MNDKELLVIKRIERIARGWFNNFKIEHRGDNIIFTMDSEWQDSLGTRREFHFASKCGKEFLYYGYLYCYKDKVVAEDNPFYPSGIYLHIFGQICDTLDGLLESYYIHD